VFESVLQVLAYTGIGLAVLVAGFIVLDLLTPGKLGQLVMEGNKGAGLITAASLISLGLVLYFAIGLDDAVVFGMVGVAVQAAGFVILDLLIPGKLGEHCFDEPNLHPAAWATSGIQLSVALIVCASLT
jgi:uncharacterized membrane protein YjfL (UPF0719 family)